MERVYRCDVDRIDGVRVTGSGALAIPAYLTRTGVLTYHNPDGSTRKELRHPDEVFRSAHLDSFRGLPVTVGHPGAVTPDNWKSVAVGHVADDVRQDKSFVAATVHVQDRSAIDSVRRGDLVELSAGYMCDIDPTPGEFRGERYDCKQTNISANHVALGARDFGRAGKEVRLRMDGKEILASIHYTNDMDVESLQKDVERLTGERDAAVARADAAEKKLSELDISALVNDRLALVQDAQSVVGRKERFDGKSDAEVMRAAISKSHPGLKLDGASDDYLRGLFAGVVKASRADKVSKAQSGPRHDGVPVEDAIAKARERNARRQAEAWKK